MYKINKLQHGKCFVRDFHIRVKIPYARAFHEVISI